MGPFIDFHCHPALKHYLLNRSVFGPANGKPEFDYTNIQVTVPAMKSAGVDAIMSVYHLPEKQIKTEWKTAVTLERNFKKLVKALVKKCEGNDAWTQTQDMMTDFQNYLGTSKEVKIAKNYGDLVSGIKDGKKVFVQTLEGAHHLGRGETIKTYRDRLRILKDQGIAVITLCHFFENDVAVPVEGIPPAAKRALGAPDVPQARPMNEKGKVVVKEMFDFGIIVDLTHTNPTARKQVFEINDARGTKKRPIVFSHVGVEKLFDDKKNPRFSKMSITDDEIIAIGKCRGLIGVIFMNYWLDGHDDRIIPSKKSYGWKNILATITYIKGKTGSFDNIAIGTDFDGMASAPRDYYDTSKLDEFKKRLINSKGDLKASDADIDKMLGGNVLRVLKEGGFNEKRKK